LRERERERDRVKERGYTFEGKMGETERSDGEI